MKTDPVLRPLFVTERALVLRKDMLLLYYTGMTLKGIAKRYGIEESEVHDTIKTSPVEERVEAEKKAQDFPAQSRGRLKAALPAVTEKLIDQALSDDPFVKAGSRLRAQEIVLEATGVLNKQSQQTQVTNVNVISREEIDMAARLWAEATEADIVEVPSLPSISTSSEDKN